ncbi:MULTISPECIES: phosphopantetheine-binding protein [Acidipropionibacterium]|uniref:phosphopantetheine-binding protein n=1 Tax=Acidipropionibacterium TaxID=1912215 RepID=UPI0004072076|nr:MULTISPECIES: phosphopantetheine-binding protein [Acidipropionibacterium]
MPSQPQLDAATRRFELNTSLRSLLLSGLDLPDDPEHVDFDEPLFGRGLELDSLDTLEIVSILEEEFGVLVSDEDRTIFGSINKLADVIEAEQQ